MFLLLFITVCLSFLVVPLSFLLNVFNFFFTVLGVLIVPVVIKSRVCDPVMDLNW